VTIRELVTSNSTDNFVPSEVSHLVSSTFDWYEIQNYYSLTDKTGLRYFENVNNYWVEVLTYAGCGGEKGIVIKKLPVRAGGGRFIGGVKKITEMYINANAQILADGMGVSMEPKEDGTPRTFKDGGKVFNYDNPDEKRGAAIVEASAGTAAAVSAAMAITSRGKSFIKDPDSLKTIREGFTGRLKGKSVKIDDVPIKEVNYKKRSAEDRTILRKKFDSTERKKFSKSLSDTPEKITDLKKRGFTDADFKKLQKGQVPKGYQVHHKLPLDDGGTNDPSNLVLIKNSPFHKVITNEQSSLTKKLITGETKVIEFPIPKGNVYPYTK